MRRKYSFRTFIITVLSVDAAFLLLGGYQVTHVYGLSALIGMILALMITTANVLVGYGLIIRMIDELSMEDFMKRVFGSMGVRMFILLGLIVAVLLDKKIHHGSFIISLFISYICKSVIEIYYINKNSQRTQITMNSDQ